MNKTEKIEGLRHFLARYGLPPDRPLLPLGVADQALGGGLNRGALHEVYAGDWAAGGFAACLAIRLAGAKPLFWVRPDYEALEYGALYPQGLVELGFDVRNLILVKTANAAEALSAASDILSCPHAGALLLELSGQPKALDDIAARRLNFIAAEKGVAAVLLHEGAQTVASAAQTRWHVTSALSGASSDDDEWGLPTYHARLIRNRLGPTGSWTMTWNPEDGLFHQPACITQAPYPGRVAAGIFDRPVEAQRRIAL